VVFDIIFAMHKGHTLVICETDLYILDGMHEVTHMGFPDSVYDYRLSDSYCLISLENKNLIKVPL